MPYSVYSSFSKKLSHTHASLRNLIRAEARHIETFDATYTALLLS